MSQGQLLGGMRAAAGTALERLTSLGKPKGLRSGLVGKYVREIEALVDETYYLKRYPHVRELGMSAAEHYVRIGWREGHDPAPWFSSEGYAEINADVADGEMPPLVHYVRFGRAEGRTIMPTEHVYRPKEDAEVAMTSPVGSDLASMRAREANNWDVHLPRYVSKRLDRL